MVQKRLHVGPPPRSEVCPYFGYSPSFKPVSNLSPTCLFPLGGPLLHLRDTSYTDSPEVYISATDSQSFHPSVSVGVFATTVPLWYFAATTAHLQVSWVVCLNNDHWNFFRCAVLPPTKLH